jgi:hypothetical protein
VLLGLGSPLPVIEGQCDPVEMTEICASTSGNVSYVRTSENAMPYKKLSSRLRRSEAGASGHNRHTDAR